MSQKLSTCPTLTKHAQIRMQQRRISQNDIMLAVQLGSRYFVNQAVIYVLGRRDLEKASIDPTKTHLDGLHVVLGPEQEQVVTVYRDPEFRTRTFQKRRCRSRRSSNWTSRSFARKP